MLHKRNILLTLLAIAFTLCFISQAFSQVLTIATDPMGTGTYGATAGIAKVLNENTEYNVKVKPTTGATEIGPLLSLGEVEIGVMHNWEAEKCWKVEMHYAEPLKGLKVAPMRIMMGGPPTFISPVIREDAGIVNIPEDLIGKKCAGYQTGNASAIFQVRAALANLGLSEDDVEMITVPGLSEAIQMLIDGRADIAGTSTPGQAILKELDSKRGCHFLDLRHTPEAIEAYRAIFPASPVVLEPSPDLTGIKVTTHLFYFEDFLIANPESVSDEMAYEMMKAVYENFTELQELSAELTRVKLESLVSLGASVPYHPGAVKFYKEIGLWNDEVEALNQKLLATEEELKNR